MGEGNPASSPWTSPKEGEEDYRGPTQFSPHFSQYCVFLLWLFTYSSIYLLFLFKPTIKLPFLKLSFPLSDNIPKIEDLMSMLYFPSIHENRHTIHIWKNACVSKCLLHLGKCSVDVTSPREHDYTFRWESWGTGCIIKRQDLECPGQPQEATGQSGVCAEDVRQTKADHPRYSRSTHQSVLLCEAAGCDKLENGCVPNTPRYLPEFTFMRTPWPLILIDSKWPELWLPSGK